MIKKSLIFIVFFIIFLIGLHLFTPITEQLIYRDGSTPYFLPFKKESPLAKIIRQFNVESLKIKNFECTGVNIKLESVVKINLRAKIFYEKDLHFRTICTSWFGIKEVDVGSNDKQFWFWSRLMVPKGLYYANHADLKRTRLKSAFHPLWVMESLGLNAIDYRHATITKEKDCIKVSKYVIATDGSKMQKVTLLNITNRRIVGYYLYQDNELIIGTEIQSYQIVNGHHVPKKILIDWPEEKTKMLWDFTNPKINIKIGNHWKMPEITPKHNISVENEKI